MNPQKIAHLSWVREPVKKSIAQSKQAMIDFTERRDRINTPPAGAEHIWFAKQNEALEKSSELLLDSLSQIESALMVIQCTGGHVLAKELLTLASVAISISDPSEQDRALLAIQESMSVLPDFIGMVIEGANDAPGVLLKYINELRALRNVTPLSDDSAMPINLSFSYVSSPRYESDCDLAERERVFNNASVNFCQLYSEAMKTKSDAPWLGMLKHLQELQRVTNDPELGSYWWVGEAIIDVIIADGLYLPPSMNAALRVVMVATQKLPRGEDQAKVNLNPGKFSSLLNSLSISRKQTVVSSAVIEHFDVKQNVEEDRIEHLQKLLDAQSVQSIADVIPEIRPRLESAMTSFGRGLSARSDEGFKAQMNAFDKAVRTIANVFGIFNESELSDLCFNLADMVKGVESSIDFNPEFIDTVKGQILFLDSRLTHLDRNPAAELLQIDCETSDVADVIAEIAYQDIVKASTMIATHVDSGVGSEKLMAAVRTINEIGLVLDFAGSKNIAGILAAVVTLITKTVENGVLTEFDGLSNCAKAIVSIELFLKYITSGLQPPMDLIEKGAGALRELGVDVSTQTLLSSSDLIDMFVDSSSSDPDIDPLLHEIFELRPNIIALTKGFTFSEAEKLRIFASTCLRLSSAGLIKGERQFSDLCKYSCDIAKEASGRLDDEAFDAKRAHSLLSRSSELILRCLDEYSSKGKIHIFMADFTEELRSFAGHEDPDSQKSDVESVETAVSAERLLPPGFDPNLKNLYDEEFAEHLATLTLFLKGQDLTVTEQVCRAVHSILGCSGSAGCDVISTLFDVLENRFYALKSGEIALTSSQASDLLELLDEVKLFQSEFPWVQETLLLPTWIEIAATMVGQSQPTATAPTEEPSAGSIDIETEELSNEIQAVPPVEEPTISPAPQPITSSKLPGNEPLRPEYNVDDVDFYLMDSDEVIPELQQNLSSWMQDMSDTEISASIRRNMHTLKGAASIIGADGIRSLTHHMESLFQAITVGNLESSKACADLVKFVINEIITMSDAVRRLMPYVIHHELIEFVEKCCDVYNVDPDEFSAVVQSSYGPKPNDAPKAPFTEPEQAEPQVSERDITEQASQGPSSSEYSDDDASENISSAAPVGLEPGTVSNASQEAQEQKPDADLSQDAESLVTPAQPPSDQSLGAAGKHKSSRRGYRGMRNRAVGERAKNFEQRQIKKAAAQKAGASDVAFSVPEPSEDEFSPQSFEVCTSVKDLIQRDGDVKEDWVTKKRSATPAKIRVDLELLDNSVMQANELKASLYRQSTLYRDMMLSILALREKLSLHLMHHSKATVQLRDFNNITYSANHFGNSELSEEQQRLNLERFNHLSVSNTQAGVQIEQMQQDCQDIIAQSHLMESAFEHQTSVVTGLQRDLLKSRLVSFHNEKQSLNSCLTAANQIAQKDVALDFKNADTLVDRLLLESIRDTFRHIVSNCVSHGIESAEEREKAGKKRGGVVTVSAKRGARSIVFTIEDDGRGIDPKVIRTKAISLGIIQAKDQLSDEELIYLITAEGFTTTSEVNELSGRGVGMDIVRNKVALYGGQLRIRSVLGKGAKIELEFPVTMGSNRAIVCSVSDQWFAIPTFNMVQVMDFPTSDLMKIKAKQGNSTVDFEGKSYEVVHLADLIAIPDLKLNTALNQNLTSLILVEQNNTRLAIEVEKGISMPEIHVTKFEGVLSGVAGIIGSTEIHDGTPAIVLDVIELARLNLKKTAEGYKPYMYRIRRVRSEVKPRVLIVDDSNSYRRLLTNHFEGLGWEVATARDGHDALDKLPTLGGISLFVVDVEMPRIDGLVLTERLRSNKILDDVPIIMLTTRSNLKERAIELGVNGFLSKPYDEMALNNTIRKVMPDLASEGVHV